MPIERLEDLPPALTETDIPEYQVQRGKVGDTFDLGDGTRLMVRSDRISTFDVVHPTGIPDKGKILTAMTVFWLREKLRELMPELKNHLISTDVADFPSALQQHRQQLEGRSMLVHDVKIFPVECIVRGYIIGSGWKDYLKSGAICGIQLPEGLQKAQKLDSPIFTPSTKATVGHDQNIPFEQAAGVVGRDVMERLRGLSLEVYTKAAEWAAQCGIILADTKFEFGLHNDEIILADEVLTPDSSRFWPADLHVVGEDPPSFDKQYVRDYVQSLGWDKNPPAPVLPPNVVLQTHAKYIEAHDRLTGKKFAA